MFGSVETAQAVQTWDVWWFSLVNQDMTHAVLDPIMVAISDWLPLVPVLLAAAWVAWRGGAGRWAVLGGLVLLFVFTDFLTSQLWRPLLERPSPFAVVDGARHFADGSWQTATAHYLARHAGSFGLPSCHAANSMGPAVYLSLFHPRLAWPLFATAGLAGLSRIYLGVHFPGDILVGYIWGGLVGWALAWLVRSALAFSAWTSFQRWRA